MTEIKFFVDVVVTLIIKAQLHLLLVNGYRPSTVDSALEVLEINSRLDEACDENQEFK